MNATHLHEHDANQGAQSSGEFLGMTGNSGWYLLGSGGATILMVVFLWGVFGVSLLLCLLVGVVLCGMSVAYVFALKNNKPEHFDTDFFESALMEAGVLQFRFGPGGRQLSNPFAGTSAEAQPELRSVNASIERSSYRGFHGDGEVAAPVTADEAATNEPKAKTTKAAEKDEPMVPRVVYERLREELTTTEELLEDALAERGEN